MNVKSFRRLAFACSTIVLNTGNLYELKFVNNEDLPNTGNLDFTLRPVARIFYGGGAIQRGDGPNVARGASLWGGENKVA